MSAIEVRSLLGLEVETEDSDSEGKASSDDDVTPDEEQLLF